MYRPASRIQTHPERPLTAEEVVVVEFLEHGLEVTLADLDKARRREKFGSASDLQIQALTLRDVIDSIRAGYHDGAHPTRVIDPKERAKIVFGRIH